MRMQRACFRVSSVPVFVAVVLVSVMPWSLLPALAAPPPEPAELPELERTGVVVPWDDFKKILEEIRHVEPPVPPEPPPVDFALSACEVTAVVTEDENQTRVHMELSVQILNPERWVEVPVIAEGVALSRFEIDGRAANVYRKNGYHRVALRGEGRHDLVLEYMTAVGDGRGSRSTVLRFPQAPVIALDLSVPRPQLSFRMPGAVVRSTERSNGSTRVLAAFQHAGDASVTWFKEAELDEKKTQLLGELRTMLSVGEGMLRGLTTAVFTIHGKGIDTFRIALPVAVNVLDVNGQGIDDWSVDPATEDASGSERVLSVRLNYLARGNYSFRMAFEQALGDTTAETNLPDLTILDALRDKGFFAVAAATNVEINPVGKIENATPVDPAELPGDLTAMAAQPILYGFKYLRHPVRVGLSIVKHDDLTVKRTIVESANLFTYLDPEGKRITSATYRIRNNRKQYLELTLPEGAESWGVYLDDRPVKAARTREGDILIPLKKTGLDASGQLEPFDVEIVYFHRESFGPWGRHRFNGPVLDVDAMEVQWHVFLPRDKRYAGFDGNLHPDDALNRIVYVDTTAYNLRAAEDLRTLQDSELGDQDLAGVVGPETPGEKRPGDDAAVLKDAAKREQVERELDKLKERSRVDANEPLVTAAPQARSNVAGDLANVVESGGRARGVLPVRFSIPMDGLRLSFTGRILTAEEAPAVSIRYWPDLGVLPAVTVFLAAFGLALTAIFMATSGRPLSGRLAVAVPAVLVLAGLIVLLPAHRVAAVLAIVLALTAYVIHRIRPRDRVATTIASSLLIVFLGATGARATEVAPKAHPAMPDLDETEVTLHWQDFKALVERTYVPPPAPPSPPADAFLRSAEYHGKLVPGILTLDGALKLEVLKDGWVRVPLATQGTVIRFDGDGALLNRTGGRLEILARGPKTLTLNLTLAFPAGDQPGANRLAINLPDAPRNLLDLQLAPDFDDVEVESGLAYDTRDERLFVSLAGGAFAMKYTLPFRRGEETVGEEVKLEPRIQLSGYQLLNLGEGVISGVQILDYNVRVAEVSHFDIDLPEDVVIFDATVANLESWKILKRDGQRFLRLKLQAPTDGKVRGLVYFEGTYPVEDGRVTVPRFTPRDVERESGFVAVAAEGAEVELQLTGRLLPADVSEIPADVRAYGGNLISSYKYSGAPDPATVAVTEHGDAEVLTAIIESLNATAAVLENGTEATWIDLTVRNNRKQFLKFTVPGDDVEVWSLLLDGKPAKPKRTGDDVLVPLPRGNSEVASQISLVLLRKGAPVNSFGRLEPYLPGFDVPVSEALWSVYVPAGRTYSVGDGEFKPVSLTDPVVPGRGAGMSYVGRAGRLVQAPTVGMYADAVSEVTAEAQVRQEEAVVQQLVQKGSARKGSLPVRIAVPGGVHRLPRVTVSRMLIVGDEPNTFPIRVYPAWIGTILRTAQPLLILGAGLWLGLILAGVKNRRYLPVAAACGLVGLLPFGGLGTITSGFLWVLCTATTWFAIALARRLRSRSPESVPAE